jgi:hypothetical protein
MWKQIRTYFIEIAKATDAKAVLSVAIYLFLVTLAPSVKLFFILSFLLFFFLVIEFSFSKALIYSSIPFLFLNVGQTHLFLVIPAKAISSLQYWEGRHLSFSLSPAFVILLAAFLLAPFFWKSLNVKQTILELLIIFIFGLSLLSAIGMAPMPTVSSLFTLQEFLPIIWGLYLVNYGHSLSKPNWYRLLSTLVIIFILLLFQEALFVLIQMIVRAPLGLIIEKVQNTPVFGLGAEEQMGTFRPFGFHYHPNFLANEQLILGSSTLILLEYLKKNRLGKFKKDLTIFLTTITMLTILLSLSRASIMAVGIGILFIFSRHPQIIVGVKKYFLKSLFKISNAIKTIFILIGGVATFRVTVRLLSSPLSFSSTGGISTRIEQLLEAFNVFIRSPYLGIGPEMFIPVSYQLFPDGVMSYFPEEIHNGFMLFITERGIFTALICIFFFFKLWMSTREVIKDKVLKTMIYSSVLMSMTVMLFHPFINFFGLNVLLLMAIINYEKSSQ